jgi:transaldolase
MSALANLHIKIFADGADRKGVFDLYRNPLIKGLTTNPTLMRKVGVSDYEAFAKEILETVTEKPISLEVFSDDFPEMRRQALKISGWQNNVYVKIPITNTKGEPAIPLIRELTQEGVKVNVTAILTLDQVRNVSEALNAEVPSVVSVFAGRVADAGQDPMPLMVTSLNLLKDQPKAELLWASCREVLNIWHAEQSGSHIITVPHDILSKALSLWGKDLAELSLDTVKMFHRDAEAAGYTL